MLLAGSYGTLLFPAWTCCKDIPTLNILMWEFVDTGAAESKKYFSFGITTPSKIMHETFSSSFNVNVILTINSL